ncbi:MAG: hypothetical protein CXX72_02130 [Methanobacteriota archaeon]|nr:MAG: hypothetical protein CXX72_02130 [Euryarchaeota archaeon]
MLHELDPMLYVLGVIIGIGCIIPLQQARKILGSLKQEKIVGWPHTRRMLLGLNVVIFGGLLASTWTWVIHRQLLGAGASTACTAQGCHTLIGDSRWNEVPLLGVEWGIFGLLAFTVLGFIALSLLFSPTEGWNRTWIKAGLVFSGLGLPAVAWLVLVELVLADGAPVICPFCTMAHIATVASFVLFLLLSKAHDAGDWEKAVEPLS